MTNLPKKYGQTFVQRSPLGNGKETIIYRVTTTIPVNIAENLGKLSGDCNIQGDRLYTGLTVDIADSIKVALGIG